ncbi:Hsp20/alpha crystallin family protein [Mobilicoccus pelagius]|uniref:Hsp20/alpha crystallin family protein n=1 Tax=Mobilicoccus pelagius TaxID=746032 RepID=UPI000A043C17
MAAGRAVSERHHPGSPGGAAGHRSGVRHGTDRGQRHSATAGLVRAQDRGSHRSEFRYGSFSRVLPLPAGCKEDITATCTDGVLVISGSDAGSEPVAEVHEDRRHRG